MIIRFHLWQNNRIGFTPAPGSRFASLGQLFCPSFNHGAVEVINTQTNLTNWFSCQYPPFVPCMLPVRALNRASFRDLNGAYSVHQLTQTNPDANKRHRNAEILANLNTWCASPSFVLTPNAYSTPKRQNLTERFANNSLNLVIYAYLCFGEATTNAIEDFLLNGKPRLTITPVHSSRNRVGTFVAAPPPAAIVAEGTRPDGSAMESYYPKGVGKDLAPASSTFDNISISDIHMLFRGPNTLKAQRR